MLHEARIKLSQLLTVFTRRCGGGKRELSDAVQHLLLLRREPRLEIRRFQNLLALCRRHAAQVTYCAFHHLASIGRQAPHLLKQAARFLLLRGSEVLPGLHAIQDARLLLGRQRAETLQSLAQAILSLRR